MLLTHLFTCFLNIVTPLQVLTNLRPTYGTIPMSLKMNIFYFKKIDGPPAKFLGKQV